MENPIGQTLPSEPDFDFYMDREDSNQFLTPPVRFLPISFAMFWQLIPLNYQRKESQDSCQDDEPVANQAVSTSFFPGAPVCGSASDLILVARDSVHFYVHSHVLMCGSGNGFNCMLPIAHQDSHYFDPSQPILAVSEHSSVFNIVLHAIYERSCTQYSPSFDTLVGAVSALRKYGVDPKYMIVPSTPLYDTLLTQASARPLDLFALAAQNDLYDLAVAASFHLLSFSLSTISDEMAERIGPIYLKRLFFMHLGRAEVLKTILLPPPYPHNPTPDCDYSQQQNLTRAWTLASAYLAWDARAGASENEIYIVLNAQHNIQLDLSTSAMESTLSPLGDHLLCELCRTSLSERIQVLTARWASIKVRWFQSSHCAPFIVGS
jgi:hypothetical protein